MTAGWNDLPIEIRIKIINEMDFISRARLGSCAKLEQQLVRKSVCKMEEIVIGRPHIVLKQGENEIGINVEEFQYYSYLTTGPPIRTHNFISHNQLTQNWTDVILDIFSTIGSKFVVEKLVLRIEKGSENKFDWFRDNVNFEPMTVAVAPIGFTVIDRFLEWPQNVKIICYVSNYLGPYLEKLNSYDNIVTFKSTGAKMTDEKLMKLPNATYIFVGNGEFTEIGVSRWLKKWLVRPDFDNLLLSVYLSAGRVLNYLKIKTELEGFITSVEHGGYGPKITLKNELNGKVGVLHLLGVFITFVAGNESSFNNIQSVFHNL